MKRQRIDHGKGITARGPGEPGLVKEVRVTAEPSGRVPRPERGEGDRTENVYLLYTVM